MSSDLYDEPPCVDEPNFVTCEHCGETFDKLDPDDENVCPTCLKMSTLCYNCDKRMWSDDDHIVDTVGRQFCSTGCQEEYMEYWFKKIADLKKRGGTAMNKLKTLDGLGASPAPWSLVGNWVVMGKDGVSLAFTSTPVGDERGAKDLDAAKAREVANANLIAAAPELYEACRKLVEWDGMRGASIEDIIAEAKTACAKAGGAMMMTRGEFVRGVVGAIAMAVGMVAVLAMLAVLIALAPPELSGEGDWNEELISRAAGKATESNGQNENE